MNLERQLTALFQNQAIDPRRDSGIVELHRLGEVATPPSARAGRCLVTLQLIVMAGYYASPRLARHPLALPLGGVQPRILGSSTCVSIRAGD